MWHWFKNLLSGIGTKNNATDAKNAIPAPAQSSLTYASGNSPTTYSNTTPRARTRTTEATLTAAILFAFAACDFIFFLFKIPLNTTTPVPPATKSPPYTARRSPHPYAASSIPRFRAAVYISPKVDKRVRIRYTYGGTFLMIFPIFPTKRAGKLLYRYGEVWNGKNSNGRSPRSKRAMRGHSTMCTNTRTSPCTLRSYTS